MSFKGIITKGEYDRGIDLRAKVVTPNKKYSSTKIFPVTIKANALSDREKCLAALNEHKALLLSLGEDLNDLSYDITDKFIESDSFGYKTSTTYKVSSTLSDYLSNTGAITKFPKYGGEDAIGTIAITTKINDISMTTHIPIVIKALSADRVLRDARLSKASLWAEISNNQDEDSVLRPLNLITTKTLADISDNDINITWSVVDTALPIFNAYRNTAIGIDNPNINKRINESTGQITMVQYPIAYGVKENLNSAGIPVRRADTGSSSQLRCFYIGGLTLKAVISLQGTEATSVITYNPMVRSQYLTGNDIFTVLSASNNKIFQYNVNGTEFSQTYPVDSVVTPKIISVDSTAEPTLTFKVQSNGENISVPQYELTSIITLAHNEEPKVLVGNVSPSASSTIYSSMYSDIIGNVRDAGNGYYEFTLNTANLRTQVETQPNASKFTIALDYRTSGYPVNGESVSANPIASQDGTGYICFEVNFINA